MMGITALASQQRYLVPIVLTTANLKTYHQQALQLAMQHDTYL